LVFDELENIMTKNFISEIEQKLRAVVANEKKRDGLKRLAYFIISCCALVLLVISVEAVGFFGITTRTVLFYSSILIIISFAAAIIYPVVKDIIYYKHPDYIETAKKVGLVFPGIKDELANAIQITKENNSNYSSQLINASFESIYYKSQKYDFNQVVRFTETKKYLRTAGFVFIISVFAIIFTPFLNSAAYRIFNYDQSFAPPQKFYFEIKPGNTEISKGDNVTIKIKTIGQKPGELFLSTKYNEQSEFTEKKLSPDKSGNYSLEMIAVKSSFDYFAQADGIESEHFKIDVINRPVITNYELQIIPPAYSKLPNIIQKDNGNITALPGSRVQLNFSASRDLSKAKLFFSDSTSKTMNINGSSASLEFNVRKEINYQMLIADEQGFSNINPINYSIKLLTDENPSIELLSPDISDNKPIKLGGDSKFSLILKIKDDYGFTKLNLNYRLSASKYRQISDEFSEISIPINKNLKEDEVYYVWDTSPLVLAEGEALTCYLEVYDNDIVSGPKYAKTPVFTIQIPSMDEIFAEAEDTQKDASKDIAETFKEAEQLQKEMQKISNDLKQNNREISWQEKERIEKAADKFKELSEKVEDVSKKLSDMQKDLMQNNLLSKETVEKYNELQKLLDEMSSDEMKEAMKKMQESLKNLMRDKAQMSMEEMKANEEYFKKSLERTVNLLKRIQVEQKVDELIKRTEDLTEKLDELKDKTDKSNLSDPQKKNELSKHQQDLSKDMNNLKDEMNKLEDKMGDMKDMPKDQLEKAMQEFENQKNEELSDEASKDLQQMQKMQAMQNQQQLSQNMQNMKQQFQNMQSEMQKTNQMKTFMDMMKIMDDMLTLSKSQENLKNKTEDMSPASPEMQNAAREQNELQNNLGKILQNMSKLSQKSFSITPEMGNALGKSYSEMQKSVSSMQNQSGTSASQYQKNAMQYLNEAANMLKSGMDQMMNGGQGGGMMSMMQQLQQLSQQQMQLNQMTQMMNQGKMTQEMAAQMQRLAQQQEMIRKSLDEMNREARESGESKKLAANLEKIMQEMKEVATNLQTQKMDDALIKQQEKILSRMLDAQRSMNERDYEKDRKSNTGQNTARTSPPDLILSTDEGKKRLKDELMKATREGYKKDYEDLIRKYFEALEK
jgi:hypothetical protein